jgi:hypothetical protein
VAVLPSIVQQGGLKTRHYFVASNRRRLEPAYSRA